MSSKANLAHDPELRLLHSFGGTLTNDVPPLPIKQYKTSKGDQQEFFRPSSDQPLPVESPKSPHDSAEHLLKETRTMRIGNATYDKDKRMGEIVLVLIPYGTMKFTFAANKDQKEGEPDYLIWHSKVRVGALWNKTSQQGNAYISGNLNWIGAPKGRRYINVFENTKSNDGTFSVMLQGEDDGEAPSGGKESDIGA